MAHYIDKDALLAEIERRVNAYQKNFEKADNKIAKLSTDGRIAGLKSLLNFIDTLEVKEVDLEEAATRYANNQEDGDDVHYAIQGAFRAGGNWQKEQMMKDAVECRICSSNLTDAPVVEMYAPKGYNVGDKIKIIIIKEENT